MPSRFILLLSLPLCWLAGCANGPAGAEAARSGHTTVITGDFPVLANGLTAEEVRHKLGEPAEIKPMNTAEGNAAVWIYYLEKYLGKSQVITYANRPSFSGALDNDRFGAMPEPVYTLVDQKVLVTLHLLMFNGRLAAQKATSEQRIEF